MHIEGGSRMEPEAFQTLLRFLKALAHESRLKLLGLLAGQERSVGELAELLGLKEPTVSHHLAKLQELDLVTPEQVASIADNVEVESWERKVLNTYFQEGRLTKIPDTRKKRDVILRWLAERFEHGVRYPEAQVNEIIKRYHPDSATLRRELVGGKLMQRENGVYWRVAGSADDY